MKRLIIILFIITISMFYNTQKIDTNILVNTYYSFIAYTINKGVKPVMKSRIVTATAYNATRNQCDSTPNIMAWNDKITKQNRNKVVAVSRDLLPILPRNTEIYFEYNGQVHKKIVLDKMGKYARKGRRNKFKIKNSIDILMDSYKEAKKFGRRKIKIFWYEGELKTYDIKLSGRSIIMLRKNVESVLIPNCKIMHVSKLGYVRVQGPDGKDYYISTNPPDNPAMYVDAYAFTKMCMYIECGKENDDTVFESFYRRNPYDGGFSLAMGLSEVVKYLETLELTGTDIDYLKSVWNFPDRFWEYLRAFKWKGTLKSLPEGMMAQPFIPIHQISAKLPVADFVETRLLNLVGGPTMVATKALRMTLANPDVPWIEMSARRASSYDAGMMIAKYAYIGGGGRNIGTSLVAAGQKYGIPIKGTSSHSAVLAFEHQIEQFRSQADIFREDSIFILDTFGYINGSQDSVQVGKEMGLTKFGGRLDTDDLAFQSKVVREILDGNGFHDAKIFLSNNIDEYVRKSLREQGARSDGDGIGTSLNPPPLDIVYKPVEMDGRKVIKLSCPQKVTDPSAKELYRMFDENGFCKAYIATETGEEPYGGIYHHRSKSYEKKKFSDISTIEQVLIPTLIDDKRMVKLHSIPELQEIVAAEAERIWPEVKRFDNPAEFPMYLSNRLWETKQELMKKFRIVKEG